MQVWIISGKLDMLANNKRNIFSRPVSIQLAICHLPTILKQTFFYLAD